MAALALVAAVVLPGTLPGVARAQDKPPLSAQERLRLGERIYREGILPSGEPVEALVSGDVSVPGTAFTCVSCHLRSGLGSWEGGVVTPPTNGEKLFKPYRMQFNRVDTDVKFMASITRRPAYNDQTLGAVLRDGVNPAGQVLNPVMPRYLLGDEDLALLIGYLRNLSVSYSPGVSEKEIHFATVITDDVPAAEYQAMLKPLEGYLNYKNSTIELYKKQKRTERMAATMLDSGELLYKRLTLSRWMLKGAPETWRSQLEEYYRKEPVFALLGGISHRDWQPIHDFSEQHQIPCLLPQTGFPVVSGNGWYTLYFSKGYFQEGESAAHYLNSKGAVPPKGRVLQIVRGSALAHALSRGFQETWEALGHEPPETVTLEPGASLSAAALKDLLSGDKPAALLLWDDSGAPQELGLLAASSSRPSLVVTSSSALGGRLGDVPEAARGFTLVTYPYRLPKDEERNQIYIADYRKNPRVADAEDPIYKGSYIVTQVLTQALMDLRGDYYRDNFFDVIGMMPDERYPLYERTSFGPGQRYASKGCYIVQLGGGARPELLRKSDWVNY